MIDAMGGFAIAYVAAVAIPGPFVATLVSRAMTDGLGIAFPMIGGAALGDLIWACLALFGLAMIAEYAAPVITVLKYAGAAYIVWIGITMMRSRIETMGALSLRTGSRWGAFLSGLSITLGNPKPMTFFLAVMPGFFDLAALTFAQKGAILMVLPPVLVTVLSIYALSAARAREMMRDAKSILRINRIAGATMMGAGIAIAAS